VYQDRQFKALFPRRGQPAAAPGRLALAVVLQFMENLSDREAADAVRGRIDWKYALGLALRDHPEITESGGSSWGSRGFPRVANVATAFS
jgi:transposase